MRSGQHWRRGSRRRACPESEVITEFQLQVENALDLIGRERVIFIDAGSARLRRSSYGGSRRLRTSCTPRMPLSPEAVLATYRRVVWRQSARSVAAVRAGRVVRAG